MGRVDWASQQGGRSNAMRTQKVGGGGHRAWRIKRRGEARHADCDDRRHGGAGRPPGLGAHRWRENEEKIAAHLAARR